ncbi:hypothetical protein FIBSPDRAFT_443602 [Athelia psychrophila]|uniref:Uncharacterized protein n=1 Tax=Athelia psychrophila TaxID=1759441 RepID=A0A167UF74_9AGAM|nr:hypothetical protein FIBSPDRAFT_443602 [Fibularhizoctonia sp. CBS 109695]
MTVAEGADDLMFLKVGEVTALMQITERTDLYLVGGGRELCLRAFILSFRSFFRFVSCFV